MLYPHQCATDPCDYRPDLCKPHRRWYGLPILIRDLVAVVGAGISLGLGAPGDRTAGLLGSAAGGVRGALFALSHPDPSDKGDETGAGIATVAVLLTVCVDQLLAREWVAAKRVSVGAVPVPLAGGGTGLALAGTF